VQSPWTVNTPLSAAEMIGESSDKFWGALLTSAAGLTLPKPLSTLLAVPIPAQHEAVGNVVQEAVELAVKESIEQGIDKRGKEVTPWLLKRVGELTSGRALDLSQCDCDVYRDTFERGDVLVADLRYQADREQRARRCSSGCGNGKTPSRGEKACILIVVLPPCPACSGPGAAHSRPRRLSYYGPDPFF